MRGSLKTQQHPHGARPGTQGNSGGIMAVTNYTSKT